MGRKRQPKQLELSLPKLARGEAHGNSGRDERPTVTSGHERPTIAERLMEEICEPGNLKRALKRVKGNKGSPGVDGMTVDELAAYVWKHWDCLREDLLQGRYGPRPVKRKEIPKPGGGVRKLGIPTADQPNRLGTDPYAGWCGRAGVARLPPIPIRREE